MGQLAQGYYGARCLFQNQIVGMNVCMRKLFVCVRRLAYVCVCPQLSLDHMPEGKVCLVSALLNFT